MVNDSDTLKCWLLLISCIVVGWEEMRLFMRTVFSIGWIKGILCGLQKGAQAPESTGK